MREGGTVWAKGCSVVAFPLVLWATWAWPWWASALILILTAVAITLLVHTMTTFEEVPY